MPRGGYDCTGAAPGSFASREGRQLFPCGGGNTPRASQASMFPGAAMQYQPVGSTTPRASQMFAAPHQGQAMAMGMGYGFHGTGAPQSGFMPQQQQSGAYMSGPGFAPAQPQMQTVTHYGYSPSTIQVPVGTAPAGGVTNPGMMYATRGGYPAPQQQQQKQHASVYGGFVPMQAPYYRHP
ncbi:hypothetical protein NLG97_g5686 [Lecanicillium saksenae]|uniref:Uncharacterized protein n=1 Tax=Lecanicillium saksenae TaxID=468837 RepID=A0ACC1QRQ7_9HYPO|nr:hypothetical protein NLG97_g5686 [Lecanicillium saksenae]